MGEITLIRGDDLSILVVDENRLPARVIEDALHEAGYVRVVVVHEISGLVRRIEETAPDVIVIDIENPHRDALESLFQVSRGGIHGSFLAQTVPRAQMEKAGTASAVNLVCANSESHCCQLKFAVIAFCLFIRHIV